MARHAEDSSGVHIVLVLTELVGLAGCHSYDLVLVGDVACVTGKLLLTKVISTLHFYFDKSLE